MRNDDGVRLALTVSSLGFGAETLTISDWVISAMAAKSLLQMLKPASRISHERMTKSLV
jgi:hypothetical protein